jgi:23S rRNA-/tRNA-specific pseudouridylate synthase
LYLVHRLDRHTSGVLLLARSAECARRMGAIFAQQGRLRSAVRKTYVALVAGRPPMPSGNVRARLVYRVDGSVDVVDTNSSSSLARSSARLNTARRAWPPLAAVRTCTTRFFFFCRFGAGAIGARAPPGQLVLTRQ